MIVELSQDQPPTLTDAERLDRLHATCHGDPKTAKYDDAACMPGPDADHVWVDIEWLRATAAVQVDDPGFADRFDGMIAYADKQGWLNATGRRVRAHIER